MLVNDDPNAATAGRLPQQTTPGGHFRREPSIRGGLLSTKIFSGF
jgi:hypothetical protein